MVNKTACRLVFCLFKSKVRETFTELENWFQVNGLKLNKEKTQLVKFCSLQSRNNFGEQINIQNNSESLQIYRNVKFLGLPVDPNLNWHTCIETTIKKLNSACFQMIVLRNSVDVSVRLMVYYGYFYSILQYGIEFWGFSSHVDRVFKVQKKS